MKLAAITGGGAFLLGLLAVVAPQARGAFTFDIAGSTGSITHSPNNTAGGGGFPKTTNYPADVSFDGASSLDHGTVPSTGTVFTSGSSKSIGKGGIDHSTSGGPDGVANLTIATGTGVSQTDAGAFGSNT